MSWATIIGEGLKLFNSWFLDPLRKAKQKEKEKQDAIDKDKELAYGEDENAMEDRINNLPD